jgi:hypothetical protein
LSMIMKSLPAPWYLLNITVISVKVLLNVSNFLKITVKMHDLCKTKLPENGYKDMNLLLRHNI